MKENEEIKRKENPDLKFVSAVDKGKFTFRFIHDFFNEFF